ncbi:MAG TPA: proliferating cell nuclear antigen (pcna) [Candidatus Nanoarchaeia archaeon]|nr:proliferating cell nuclear antigen (pcna) [Candidatus Nanoarchaeia archaeon]
MKLTLTEPRYLKDSILIISELVNDVNLKFTKDKVELVAVDPATVALVIFKLLSSACSEYTIDKERVIGINLGAFTQILKRAKPTDILTLELEEDKNRLSVLLKGTTVRKFDLSLLDIDEREQKIPNLKFATKIETNTLLFTEAIEDMDIVADNLTLSSTPATFLIYSQGTTSSARVEINNDEETSIETTEQEQTSRYSIEYLKKIVKASKLASNVTLEFGQDYPLRAEYKVLDKLSLQFVLAPRIPND